MKIEIKSMTLQNFKKVRSQQIEFGHNMLISGGNKVGKTTIYDAYLWCIFGVTSKQNGVVQPLDANNNIIHKLETSVTVLLNYNDEREVKVQRVLSEKWKAKDTAEEQFCGTTQERLVNDIPLSVSAFNKKLSEMLDCDRWLLLSNINLFWAKKVDERRRILMALAGNINEHELMESYPLVFQSVVKEGKNLDEMLAQNKLNKRKAEDEQKVIPAKVQAQDMLRSDADFPALKEELRKVDAELAILNAALQGVAQADPSMEKYLADIQALNLKIARAQKDWQDAKLARVDRAVSAERKAYDALRDAQVRAEENRKAYIASQSKLASVSENFASKAKAWKEENDRQFDFTAMDVCPVCGRPYTEEMKEREYENAVAEYNKAKAERLAKIQNEAIEDKQCMTILKGNVSTYERITKEEDEQDVNAKRELYEDLRKKRLDEQGAIWEDCQEKMEFDKLVSELEAGKPTPKETSATSEGDNERKRVLVARRDDVIRLLAGEQTNARIEQEKERLSKRSLELAQISANCSEAVRQIKAFKKAKITAVESKVNSYFSLVRWKFYEQNVTNDDEKEICAAIDKDGIDYGNTNDGSVINMGVDIIGGISRATDTYVPLFVDRKESAEHIVAVEQQAIFLQCVFGEPLKIEKN